jgi:hypothetical protein
LVFHLGDGRWWDEEAATWRNGRGRALSLLTQPPAPGDEMILTTKVVLATAHLDHNPSNNKTRNLKAYCQRCHMLHDRSAPCSDHKCQARLPGFRRRKLGTDNPDALPAARVLQLEPPKAPGPKDAAYNSPLLVIGDKNDFGRRT